ncbi:nuclear distribution protein nudE [Metarhizium guizhouense ARSEF 977]|uniref:Nuclear distribution protein nudE n=1 Tax=Metarhizium guizhouense (strain ARSEF 977) TaxID=1276136 RepID=A0A0B4H6I1_METGA|nr:nuclear distribution protein nudE [Metarhizium guizhouense ARSEF 977]
MAEPPSSPPSEAATAEDALTWYKSQYEMLESELAEFRESSRELEQELEKDIERAEKQERALQEKVETLGFEVEEWKRKYKESKSEASAAQNSLEKEITTLRDSNRSLQLKLRDVEVANDDFERQARNTTSSLEDMESKYNQAIERGVMMEEEIKSGEQERENLRIESQRLREELAELKIEAELMQDKIKKHEARHLSTISTDLSVMGSPTFDKNTEGSPNSTASSPLITTPPETKSLPAVESLSQVHEPPSPPMSDASAPTANGTPAAKAGGTLPRKSRLPSLDHSVTPKPRGKPAVARQGGRISGGPSSLRTPAPRSTAVPGSSKHKIPASNSLSHIRSLTAQMQRLEARVHSARSKLPAPTHTPPRASPRPMANGSSVPSTVTIRSRKRTTGSSASSLAGDETTPTNFRSSTSSRPSHVPRLSTTGVSRLSFGPLPNRAPESDASHSRPNSRASVSSYARPSSRTDMIPPPRPMSRSSITGARTPLGRPRSSLSGSVHGHSQSMSRIEMEEDYEGEFRTPSRRGTYSKVEMEGAVSGIPVPGTSIPTPGARRQSGSGPGGRRTSTGVGTVRPGTSSSRKLSDLGETY